ncbi:MAG: hypothetical protein QOC82_1948 [Frankiaceae bacterium]|jgi:hypothetical protein|nr:hypothetical protein [Frankiaceae bacterium]
MCRPTLLWLAARWPHAGHALSASAPHARQVTRIAAVAGVIALLATAAPSSAGSEPSTVDTWTIPGCVVTLTNTFVAAHGHAGAHWHTDGAVTCTGSQLDAEERVDLTRNDIPIAKSFVRASCNVSSLELCDAVHAASDTAYRKPRADWRARLVLFVRGPLSVPAWKQTPECVIDIPSFETICTFVGRVTRR